MLCLEDQNFHQDTEKMPQESYPLADACQVIIEERFPDGVLPQEVKAALVALRFLEENSPENSLAFCFELLAVCQIPLVQE